MLVVVVEILVHVSLSHLVTHASASAAPADGVDFHTLAGRCISSNHRASGPNSHTHTPVVRHPFRLGNSAIRILITVLHKGWVFLRTKVSSRPLSHNRGVLGFDSDFSRIPREAKQPLEVTWHICKPRSYSTCLSDLDPKP